jgi:hypothetical protein
MTARHRITIVALAALLAGCGPTYLEQRAQHYYAQYLDCLDGGKGSLSMVFYRHHPREQACREAYEEDLRDLGVAASAGSVTVQPVYILGR